VQSWTAVPEEVPLLATTKTGIHDGSDVTCSGRLIQMWAVMTGKAQSQIVYSCTQQTVSDIDEVECRYYRAFRSTRWLSLSARYVVAAPC